MSEPTTINDEAVAKAEAAAWEEQGRPDEHGGHCSGLRLPIRIYRAALVAALPVLLPTREAIEEVLLQHNIESTGLGEVTCRGCRERSWMSWPTYRRHLADAILALINPTQDQP